MKTERQYQWFEGLALRHEHGRDHINVYLLRDYLEAQAATIESLRGSLLTAFRDIGRLELALEKKLDRPQEWDKGDAW